jgi:hypothetical protein
MYIENTYVLRSLRGVAESISQYYGLDVGRGATAFIRACYKQGHPGASLTPRLRAFGETSIRVVDIVVVTSDEDLDWFSI